MRPGELARLGKHLAADPGALTCLAGGGELEELERGFAEAAGHRYALACASGVFGVNLPIVFPVLYFLLGVFESSIMLGFYAEGLTEEITIDPSELRDARWFSRAEVHDPDAHGFSLPRRDSIARRLIEDWLAHT